MKILILCGVLLFMAFGCEKEKTLPKGEAKGKIIKTFAQCYGFWVMIEVEEPKGIGASGTFAFPGVEESRINYKNAIGVPYFSRIPHLNTDAPDTVGTWLHFEYRELTNEERNSQIFVDTSFHGICNTMIGPPDVNMYMLTKILDYY
jgi:hypothetical protein